MCTCGEQLAGAAAVQNLRLDHPCDSRGEVKIAVGMDCVICNDMLVADVDVFQGYATNLILFGRLTTTFSVLYKLT